MKTFGKLPSSPDIRGMNDAQWLFCYMNIIKDEEEEEELWKSRAKYHGLFVNPEAVKNMAKFEEQQKTGNITKSHRNTRKNDDVYVNDEFEKELQKAMSEDFIEIPDSNTVRGNPSMSSDDFINMCLDNVNELERNENNYINNNFDDDDLDIIEINE